MEIILDHREQAKADERHPLLRSEIVEALFTCLAIGLVKALPGASIPAGETIE